MTNAIYLKDAHGDYTQILLDNAINRLAAGVYTVSIEMAGLEFSPMEWKSDDMFRFSTGPAMDAIADIERFWTNQHRFDQYGMVGKRALLLYGAPGTGKTCTLHQIAEEAVERDAVCLFSTNNLEELMAGVKGLRAADPERKIVLLFEDIDQMRKSERLLAILDGQMQVSNVVVLATTNYIEQLPPRLVNRPGRLDRVLHIGPPSQAQRQEYLHSLLNNEPMAAVWAAETEGFSLAHLRELVVSVMVMEFGYDESLSRLRERLNWEDTPVDDDEPVIPEGLLAESHG